MAIRQPTTQVSFLNCAVVLVDSQESHDLLNLVLRDPKNWTVYGVRDFLYVKHHDLNTVMRLARHNLNTYVFEQAYARTQGPISLLV